MKTITSAQRLQLIGLLTIGDGLNEKLQQVEAAMLEITGEKTDGFGSGHCSDALYGTESSRDKEADVDRLLERLDIKVST